MLNIAHAVPPKITLKLKRSFMKFLLTFLASTLISFQVMAADLTKTDLDRWMKSMPELQSWLATNEEKLTAQISEPKNPEAIFSESISALKNAGLYDELNSKVKKMGYENVEEWSDISKRITFSWVALDLEANKAKIDAAKAQYEAIMANPDIPAAQKEMMKNMMSAGFAMTNLANDATPEDKKIVNAHKSELRAFFEENDK